MIKKTCTICGNEKSLDEFDKNKKGRYGRAQKCKSCLKIWRDNNKTEIRINYNKNKEKYNKRKSEYYQENKFILDSNNKKWYLNNKENVLEYKKQWRFEKLNNPEYKFECNIKALFREKVKNKNYKVNSQLFEFVGIDKKEYFSNIKKSNYWNNYCNKKEIEIDHIIPISAYDFNNLEEIKKCWNPKNIRLIYKHENREKSNKIDMALILKYDIKHLLPEKLSGQ